MAYVDWLTDGRLPRAVAGGKGASLSELTAAGFIVPPGFVVNAEGYRYFIEAGGLDPRIDVILRNADLALPAAASEAAREISALIR
jgi:pyruvate,water dikinase